MKVFVDTLFLIAQHNAKDSNHRRALQAFADLLKQDARANFIITDYIFDELATFLMTRVSKHLAIKIGQNILQDGRTTMIQINKDRFYKAWETFSSKQDQSWSFTDCTSFIVIQELAIQTALSFDRHFRQFGIRVLP